MVKKIAWRANPSPCGKKKHCLNWEHDLMRLMMGLNFSFCLQSALVLCAMIFAPPFLSGQMWMQTTNF